MAAKPQIFASLSKSEITNFKKKTFGKKTLTHAGTGAIGNTQTHLQSQYYTICFRREAANCQNCYIPNTVGINDTPTNQGSFGLSTQSIAITANAQAGSICLADFLEIPGGAFTSTSGTIRAVYTNQLGTSPGSQGADRFCGRKFGSPGSTIQNTVTVCSKYKFNTA